MIVTIYENATLPQLHAAVGWVSDQLHVPASGLTATIAVAYVCRHFESGQLTGWDGFIQDLEG